MIIFASSKVRHGSLSTGWLGTNAISMAMLSWIESGVMYLFIIWTLRLEITESKRPSWNLSPITMIAIWLCQMKWAPISFRGNFWPFLSLSGLWGPMWQLQAVRSNIRWLHLPPLAWTVGTNFRALFDDNLIGLLLVHQWQLFQWIY